jgi:translation initiation factor IF-3
MVMNKQKNTFYYKVNNDIKGYPNVRLIYKEHSNEDCPNDFNKVVSLDEAKYLSNKMQLDLIEINNRAVPPIVRLCDYSKFIWEQKKKEKAKAKTNNGNVLKEIQLRANIADNDLETKAKAALKFMDSGFKVKIVLTLRGREMTRKDFSKESFYKFLSMVGENAVYDLKPKEEGNKTYAIIRKKQ